MPTPKLHEVLAVEAGLQTTAKKINEEAIGTFRKKDEHFVGASRRLTHFAEEDAKLDTQENKELVTTVGDKLRYITGANIRALDAFLQKEATNQLAKGTIEVDGATLVVDVPATALLGLENRLTELRAVYDAIPTLAPGESWSQDANARPGIFKARDATVTFRTKKTIRPIVLHPATKEHPAQVNAISEDVPIARIETHQWSGMLPSAEKAKLLERLDKLIRAVKRARQRANNQEVEKRRIGEALFAYLHSDIV